jgi:hypothetical protein
MTIRKASRKPLSEMEPGAKRRFADVRRWPAARLRDQICCFMGVIMKAALVFLVALFLSVASADPAGAQTRTVRHPDFGSPALTVDLPGDWTSTIDPDNNLIIAGPGDTVAFSLSVADDAPEYTLEEFAKAAFGVANVNDVTSGGDAMIPPYSGGAYLGHMETGGQTLSLRMLVVRVPTDKIVSATMITGPDSSAEDTAVGEMILKTIRIVR